MSFNSKIETGDYEGVHEKTNFGYVVDLPLERTVVTPEGETYQESFDWDDITDSLDVYSNGQGFIEILEDHYKHTDGWAVEYIDEENVVNIPATVENNEYSVSTDRVAEALVYGHMSVKESLAEVLEEVEDR